MKNNLLYLVLAFIITACLFAALPSCTAPETGTLTGPDAGVLAEPLAVPQCPIGYWCSTQGIFPADMTPPVDMVHIPDLAPSPDLSHDDMYLTQRDMAPWDMTPPADMHLPLCGGFCNVNCACPGIKRCINGLCVSYGCASADFDYENGRQLKMIDTPNGAALLQALINCCVNGQVCGNCKQPSQCAVCKGANTPASRCLSDLP